jgi:hypothetical protein
MAPSQVLRFSRSDEESSFVLVQVVSTGSRPLDLRLVGTEGEAPYVAICKLVRTSRPISSQVEPWPAMFMRHIAPRP